MANQTVQGKPVQDRTAKKVEGHLAKYNRSEALLNRYKSLIENSRKGKNGKEPLAESSGGNIVIIFTSLNYTINWENTNVLDTNLSELGVRSLDILERVISECPENIDDYVNVFETIGTIYRNREYSENVIPLLETSISIISGWKNIEPEDMETKLRVLSRSVQSCIGMISKLNKHGISEKLDDNVFRMYPSRKYLIQLYLNRELTALGSSFSDETENLVLSLFSKIDDNIKDFITENYPKKQMFNTHPPHVGRHIRMSRKIALLIGKDRLDFGELYETLRIEGLDGLQCLVNLAESND